jgi:prevent-host-death family protein
MAITVGSRELKVRLGTHLRQVRQGRTLIITDRGVPVAELRPIELGSGRDAILRTLEAHGAVTRPVRPRLAPFTPIASRGRSIAEAVALDRRDRF